MLFVPSIPVIFNRSHVYQGAGGGHGTIFTDSFTGANGSTPNARWTQKSGTWTIQNNRLENTGGVYGEIWAATAVGDQVFTFDQDFGANSFTFAEYIIRWVDNSNYLYYQLNGSDILTFNKFVAGVSTTLQTDSVTRCGSGAGSCSVSITVSGNSFTFVVTGGAQTPGTFGPFTESTFAASGAGVGFGMNTSKSGCYFDNAQVSN